MVNNQRKLIDVTVRGYYPLLLLQDCINALEGYQYFSTLDMGSGYYYLEVAEEDRDKTAFVTKYGLFSYRRLPFRKFVSADLRTLCGAYGTTNSQRYSGAKPHNVIYVYISSL